MNLFHIAWNYLWRRRLTTSLTVFSVATGVALISTVMTLRREAHRSFIEQSQSCDAVVGAKGSPLQLTLSTLYYLDVPTGNILYSDYEKVRANPHVASAYPLGLGDNYRGFRIVGTTPEFFQQTRARKQSPASAPMFRLAAGRLFEQDMEVVVGSFVARSGRLDLGDQIIASHGVVPTYKDTGHEATPYTVVGILEPTYTANDRALFASLSSVWKIHGHDEHPHGELEITAVLVRLKSAARRFSFVESVNTDYNAMAAIPAMQIAKFAARVLMPSQRILLAIACVVVLVAAISILVSLYLATSQRKRDLAIMRGLGASASEVFRMVLTESLTVSLLGVVAGLLLGHGASAVLGHVLYLSTGIVANPLSFSASEILACSVVFAVGLAAGLLPAWEAYTVEVAAGLSDR
jgi:putative ABC transport system permease protein